MSLEQFLSEKLGISSEHAVEHALGIGGRIGLMTAMIVDINRHAAENFVLKPKAPLSDDQIGELITNYYQNAGWVCEPIMFGYKVETTNEGYDLLISISNYDDEIMITVGKLRKY